MVKLKDTTFSPTNPRPSPESEDISFVLKIYTRAYKYFLTQIESKIHMVFCNLPFSFQNI